MSQSKSTLLVDSIHMCVVDDKETSMKNEVRSIIGGTFLLSPVALGDCHSCLLNRLILMGDDVILGFLVENSFGILDSFGFLRHCMLSR